MYLPSFTQLKKYAKRRDPAVPPACKLAVIGDCATQHLAAAIAGYAQYAGLDLAVFDADYDQLDAQIMDPGSELYAFGADWVLLYMSTEKLLRAFYNAPAGSRERFAEDTFQRIDTYWRTLSGRCPAGILQFDLVSMDDGCFGSYALKTDASFVFQLRKLKYLLAEGCRQNKNVYPVDINAVQLACGRDRFHDSRLYYAAKLPISLDMLPAVAKRTVDVILAQRGQVKKCVVTDLDNTLWGGVVGDDGLEGIQIGELGSGPAFTHLQMWLKALKERGILLAVCSKNNEDAAREPFEKHPDMVLRMEDLSIFVANWEDKASNIRYIQKMLNIGLDAMVFLDDSPFERERVRQALPEVTVPELPEDPALYVPFLQELDLFETASYSREDAGRTKQYRDEAVRREMLQNSLSYDDYLAWLEMRAYAGPFDPFHYPRIAQLTQRSNQFNLRTVRYTEAQIQALAADPAHITRYYTLRDKLGDYGLISVAVLDRQDEDTLFISQWLMSCRVLKRTMEEFILNDLVRLARDQGCARLVGEYIKTPKNAMVADIYERMGFRRDGAFFVADTERWERRKTLIQEDAQ